MQVGASCGDSGVAGPTQPQACERSGQVPVGVDVFGHEVGVNLHWVCLSSGPQWCVQVLAVGRGEMLPRLWQNAQIGGVSICTMASGEGGVGFSGH